MALLFMLTCPRAEADKVRLQLKWHHQFQFAGYYAAQAQGYYQAAGLDVEIMPLQPGKDPVQQVLQGDAEFGVGSTELLLLREQRLPVVVLAVIFQHSPLALMTLKRGELQSVHDLAGQKVMMEPGSSELYAYLGKEGVSSDTFTPMPHGYHVKDLIAGNVAAMSTYVTDEPFEMLREGQAYQLYSPRAAGIDFYGDNLFTTERQLRLKPERVKAFRESSLKGWEYAMRHPEETAQLIHARYSPRHSLEHLRFEAAQMLPLLQPGLVEIGHMHPGRWRHIAQTYAELGMLKPGFDLSGFLYDPLPQPPDLTWLYLCMAVAAVVIALVSAFAVYICRINVRLRHEASERRRAEEALRESAESYRSILNASPDDITITDLKGLILMCSPAALPLFGYAREDELLGRPITDFIVPEDHARAEASFALLFQDRRQMPSEYRGLRADGSTFDIEVNGDFIRDADGRPARIILVVRDITERKQAEAYREMGRDVLQILNAPDDVPSCLSRVLAVLKTRTGVEAVGIRLQEGDDFPYVAQLGFAADFLQAENTLTERDGNGAARRDGDGNLCLEGTCGLVLSGRAGPETSLVTPAGSFWTNDASLLLQLPSGEDPRHHPRNLCVRQGYASLALVPVRDKERVVGLIQLNDRRKGCFTRAAVERLEGIADHIGEALMRKRAESALRESEALFRSVAEGAFDGLVLLDTAGYYLYANTRAVEMTGFTAEELQRSTFESLLHPLEAKRVRTIFEDQMSGRPAPPRYETVLRRKNGHSVPLEVSAREIAWRGQRTILGMYRDISERRRLEREVLRIGEWEKTRIGQDLHDSIGQQLVGMAYLVAALEQDLRKAGAPQATAAAQISECCKIAHDQLRGIARGLLPINMSEGLPDGLKGLADNVQSQMGVACTCRCTLDANALNHSSSGHLYHIAQEAVTNAIRHGKARQVDITLEQTGGRGELVIDDDGNGFSPTPAKESGSGLKIMRYRADMIRGALAVARNTRGGMSVRCTFDMAPGLDLNHEVENEDTQ